MNKDSLTIQEAYDLYYNTNNERLRALMKKHNLTRKKAAEMCGTTKSMVDCWLAPNRSAHYRVMLDKYFQLLVSNLITYRI